MIESDSNGVKDQVGHGRSLGARLLRRIHGRLDAIFIFGFLALLGFMAYWTHVNF